MALEDRLLTDPISTQAIAGNDYNQTTILAVLRFKGEAGRVWMQWLGTGNTRIGLESDAIFDWGNMADNTRCRLAGWNVGQDSVRIVSAVKTPSAMTVHVDGSLAAQHKSCNPSLVKFQIFARWTAHYDQPSLSNRLARSARLQSSLVTFRTEQDGLPSSR